jgi:hypothetical protein
MQNEGDVGTIKMRMPGGRQSSITVSHAPTGAIDIHFERTSEGEALMRLPVYAAKQLGELLMKAAAVTTAHGGGQ